MRWLEPLRDRPGPRRWRAFLWQALALVTVPSLLALGANAVRPEGLPWISRTDYREAILVPCPEHLVEATAVRVDELPSDLFGTTLLDARTPGEYLGGHLPGAISVPWNPVDGVLPESLPGGLRGLGGHGSVDILVCGDARIESGRALGSRLRELGFQHVRYLEGGCAAWLQAGRSVERSDDAVVRLALGDLHDLTGWTVVDARFSRNWRRGHVPGALSIAYRMVDGLDDARLAPLRGVPGHRLLVYGSAERGEGEALARLLASGGWAGVAILEGGYEAWAESRPIETDPPGAER